MASLLPLPLFLIIIVLCIDVGVDGFAIYSPTIRKRSSSSTSTTQQYLIDHDLALEMGAARGAFALCFYGALGVGSIGRELIPIVFKRYESNSNLKSSNKETTEKKTDLNIRGYADPIYLEDVQSILSNTKMDAISIATKYQEDKSEKYEYTHIETQNIPPFLTFEAYQRAHPTSNPVALRAVFDSFSNSLGGIDSISPITAQERIDEYTSNINEMVQRLNRSKVLGLSAFIFVLLLLGFVDYLTIYHLWRGFFPEWNGFMDLPFSLFDEEIGIGVLPKYFVWEIPDI